MVPSRRLLSHWFTASWKKNVVTRTITQVAALGSSALCPFHSQNKWCVFDNKTWWFKFQVNMSESKCPPSWLVDWALVVHNVCYVIMLRLQVPDSSWLYKLLKDRPDDYNTRIQLNKTCCRAPVASPNDISRKLVNIMKKLNVDCSLQEKTHRSGS